ncbi:MAG: hypothetical protein FVQ84_19705 [Planctomycetes bacterium]|nr:hypothetical protein [Planctomycetota bacterium]
MTAENNNDLYPDLLTVPYPATKPKSPGRPKKKEPGRSSASQKPGGKGKSEAKASNAAEGAATT